MQGDLWSCGYTSFAVLITVHHVMICINTRNFTWPLVLSYLISFSMFFPLVTLVNDHIEGSDTYQTIVPDVLGASGVFWLTYVMCVVLICMPVHFKKCQEMILQN